MLINPAAVASAVMQWMQCPELKAGQFLPERLQIAAYLGQLTVGPATRNEDWKEWANLGQRRLPQGNPYRVAYGTKGGLRKQERSPFGLLVWIYATERS